MVKICIIGKDEDNTIENTLISIFKVADFSYLTYEKAHGTFDQIKDSAADIFIAPIKYKTLKQMKMNIDVFVFTENADITEGEFLNLVNERACIIINADDKRLYKYLLGTKANVLTIGFNAKASVTASSIEESMETKFIQLCVQRSFCNIKGNLVEAQEIPVTLRLVRQNDIINELLAITTALACGVNMKALAVYSLK